MNRLVAITIGTLAIVSAISGCVKGPVNADALLGKTIAECNSIFGKHGMVRISVLSKSQRRFFTGHVTPLSRAEFNYRIWPREDNTPYCVVSLGIVVDCYNDSIMTGTKRIDNSKETIGLATSDHIFHLDHIALAALSISDVAGLERAKSTNIVNPESFSGVITYRASFSRYLYTTVIRDGVVDSVEVTDIGEYGETAL